MFPRIILLSGCLAFLAVACTNSGSDEDRVADFCTQMGSPASVDFAVRAAIAGDVDTSEPGALDLAGFRSVSAIVFSTDVADGSPDELADDVSTVLAGLNEAVASGDAAPINSDSYATALEDLTAGLSSVCG